MGRKSRARPARASSLGQTIPARAPQVSSLLGPLHSPTLHPPTCAPCPAPPASCAAPARSSRPPGPACAAGGEGRAQAGRRQGRWAPQWCVGCGFRQHAPEALQRVPLQRVHTPRPALTAGQPVRHSSTHLRQVEAPEVVERKGHARVVQPVRARQHLERLRQQASKGGRAAGRHAGLAAAAGRPARPAQAPAGLQAERPAALDALSLSFPDCSAQAPGGTAAPPARTAGAGGRTRPGCCRRRPCGGRPRRSPRARTPPPAGPRCGKGRQPAVRGHARQRWRGCRCLLWRADAATRPALLAVPSSGSRSPRPARTHPQQPQRACRPQRICSLSSAPPTALQQAANHHAQPAGKPTFLK